MQAKKDGSDKQRHNFCFKGERQTALAHALKYELPALFEGKECPIHLDHCFMRIVYDAIVQDDWRKKVKAPAIANFSDEQVEKGMKIVEAIKTQGAYYVAILDQQSLTYRNKKQKNKSPESYLN